MKIHKILLLTALLFSMVTMAQERGERVNVRISGEGFEDFVKQVEAQTDLVIYYNSEWFSGRSFTYSGDSVEAEDAIYDVLKGSGLHFSRVGPTRLVVLPQKRLNMSLPVMAVADRGYLEEGTGEGTREGYLGVKDPQYLTGIRPEQIAQTIEVGNRGTSATRGVARVKGKLVNLETGEPVMGATMVDLESGKGSVSDQNGNITMALKPGKHSIRFSFIGMENMNITMEVFSDGEFQVEMRPAVIALDEVQIMGQQYRDINTTDMGVERFSMNSLKQVPVFMGERDVIKISKLLPGITSAGEASVGVNVRGGNVDQNIFYINRLPVYNTSHLFGFFSAFNSDMIRDFSIYKGSVPVNYGGRLSSVFNILTRKGNNKSFTAHAGISPVSANVTAEGPIRKDHSSFLISGRSSYSDWILNQMEDPLIRDSDAFFYDFAGSVNFQPNTSNVFNVFYYQSYDKFRYSTLSDYEYANRGGSVSWENHISPALTSKVIGTSSIYRFANTDQSEISRAYTHEYMLNHNEVLAEFEWVPNMNHKIDFGSSLIFYRLDRGSVEPYGDASIRNRVDLGFEQALEGAVFISDNINVTDWLTLYAGVRYSLYTMLGPHAVMLYEEGKPKSENTIVDTLAYGKTEPISFHSGPEFRTAVNMKAGPNTSFKLSFNQMRQYLFMLSNTVTISPTDQWKLADYHIDPQSSYQVTGGFYHIFPRLGLSSSVELYYKYSKDIVEYKDGADFITSPLTETVVLQGLQNAYGAEFMLQKISGRLDGWISYTLSRSEMLVQGNNEFESINNGQSYPSNFDRPHVLNVVANYNINRRFSVGSNLVYMSGRPVTYPTSLYYINTVAFIDYYARNQFRIPDYFRMDLSFNIEGNLKADKFMHSTWSLNVYNLLGRNNPQSIYFTPNEYFIKGYAFSVIGAPIFTISWNVKMGNYESH
ncbi:MAG: TonB-dependent receptor [Bacteroidales bacterium]|nr:TonB-dependent receptor [Bacteroidales bacterium]